MALTTVGAALDLLTKASKALDSLRERAKTSKDAELKENISNLYDRFLDLKETVLRIKEENAELRRTVAAQTEKPPKPEIQQVGQTNYYFVGDEGPYCQKCYDGNGKLVRLSPEVRYVAGWGRMCPLCETIFYE